MTAANPNKIGRAPRSPKVKETRMPINKVAEDHGAIYEIDDDGRFMFFPDQDYIKKLCADFECEVPKRWPKSFMARRFPIYKNGGVTSGGGIYALNSKPRSTPSTPEGMPFNRNMFINKGTVVYPSCQIEWSDRTVTSIYHDTIIGPHCRIHKGADIRQFCFIGDSTRIGDNSEIGMCSYIDKEVFIGSEVEIEDGVKLGECCSIDRDTIIRRNSKIEKFAEVGVRVTIDEDVTIGISAAIEDSVRIYMGVTIGEKVRIVSGTILPESFTINEGDKFLMLGPIGSRHDYSAVVISKTDILWWIGCQQGITTATLKRRIEDFYPIPDAKRKKSIRKEEWLRQLDYRAEYLAAIAFVEAQPAAQKLFAAREASITIDTELAKLDGKSKGLSFTQLEAIADGKR